MQTSIRTDAAFKDLLRVTPLRLVVTAIVARVQPKISEGHADLASSPPSSPVRGQSRLTNITGNEGCVRYPTEGNDSDLEVRGWRLEVGKCISTLTSNFSFLTSISRLLWNLDYTFTRPQYAD